MGIVEREEKPSSIVDRRTVSEDSRMCVFVGPKIYLSVGFRSWRIRNLAPVKKKSVPSDLTDEM